MGPTIIKLHLHLLLSSPDMKNDDHSSLPKMDAKVFLYLLEERELVYKKFDRPMIIDIDQGPRR